jgi:antitoxin ParD1/3/4
MPTRNINLTDHLDRFIEAGVASGRYSDASEIVREGLRLLEQREQEEQAKLEWLRGAVREGLDQIERGEGIEFLSMQELEDRIDCLGEETSAQDNRA